MNVFRHLEDIPADLGRSVVSVGNFDGVHRAHRHVLNEIGARARQIDAKSVAVTFEPHPVRILRPDAAPPLITPLPVKLRLLDHFEPWHMLAFGRNLLLRTIYRPPSERGFSSAEYRDAEDAELIGSNAYAIGPSRTRHGSTMLFSNPHQPYYGFGQFYEGRVAVQAHFVCFKDAVGRKGVQIRIHLLIQ